ncbi:MAG: LysE family translocator [Planctomycetota bacterium]
MPTAEIIALFMLAALALNLTPGPDMLYVVSRSIGQGASAGVMAATGGLLGSVVHTVAAVLGLSAVLMSSATAFTIVKFAGAGYLAFLGVRALLRMRSGTDSAPEARAPASMRRVFLEAFTIHTLNPKVAIFFLAFLPQFIDPAGASPALGLAVLGSVFVVQAWAVNSLIACAAASVRRALANPRITRWLDGATGVLFLGFGARLAFAAR